LKYIALYIVLFFSISVFTQELPPIKFYTPNQYKAENQNWAISQADNKNIYIANNKGLLEFNGASWQLYPSQNETIVRSVKVVNDTIFTGCYMDFGFWKKNIQGFLEYTSLTQKLDINIEEDEQFWNIMEVDNWLLFQSLDNIYILNRKDFSVNKISSSTTITKIYKVENNIYFQRLGEGIYRFENGKDILVYDHSELKENIIINIFKNDNNIIFVTQDKGFYYYKDGQLSIWDIPASSVLSNITIYSGIQLKDKRIVIGTISDGIVILDDKGDVIYSINQDIGLGNNTILSLFEDADGNIWLGLDKGLNYIEMNGAFINYKDSHGELGTIYASTIYEGKLYLGTNQGLFFKEINTNSPFTMIEGSQGQVWCLVRIDNILLCGHNLGTFKVKNNRFELISKVQGTWDIKKIEGKDDKILQGNYNGLHLLEKNNGSWKYKNKIKGFDISSRYFEFINENEILVNHEYKGIFKIKVDSSLNKALSVSKEPIEKGLYSSLVKYNDDILYTYNKGIFKYNESDKKFVRDSILSLAFNEKTYSSGKLIVDWDGNSVWSFSDQELIVISHGKMSDIPVLRMIPLPNLLRDEGVIGFENILKLNAKKYLLGTSSGYMIIDLDKLIDKKYHLYLNSLKLNSLNNRSVYLDISKKGEFKNKENNIEFFYNVPEFDIYVDTQYQYRLIGYNEKWSEWTKDHTALYKNLPHGDFTFQVRAKVGNTLTENVESYSFYIEKPFLLSNVAILFYVLSGISFLLLYHSFNRRHFKNKQRKVLEKTQKELALKELEYTKQKITFKNKSLEQDIKNKNRELAISTMSLIKKNELLNNIKNELKKAENYSELKPVIQTIDSNLNNTDDWELFEKAFNNADKDFLKKVKQKHQNLNHNDLRLCAYLRLNLSSKEISPLLNITLRSVEIRRYRLRKKIDLPREINLNDYFMSL
jgi:hypothetical protein